MKELCPGILVDEPAESAVRQGGSNQLGWELRRQLRALEDLFQCVGFPRPADEEENLAAGVEHRRGQCQPDASILGT